MFKTHQDNIKILEQYKEIAKQHYDAWEQSMRALGCFTTTFDKQKPEYVLGWENYARYLEYYIKNELEKQLDNLKEDDFKLLYKKYKTKINPPCQEHHATNVKTA